MLATDTLSFHEAARLLRQKLQTGFSQAAFRLNCAKMVLQVQLAYQQLYPDHFNEKLAKHMFSVRLSDLLDETQTDKLRDSLMDAVAQLFPIDVDAMEANWQPGEDAVIYIEAQNISMSWDEFDELLQSPLDLAASSDALAFPMLIWSINNDVSGETWETLSEALGWNTRCPKYGANTYIDRVSLRARLKKQGLLPFETAILFAWKDTGNYFIDFDPYDESNYGPAYSFSADAICELAREYQQALPIIREYNQAMKMLDDDPSIFDTLTRLIEQSLVEREKK